jgi:hypothetical protein
LRADFSRSDARGLEAITEFEHALSGQGNPAHSSSAGVPAALRRFRPFD